MTEETREEAKLFWWYCPDCKKEYSQVTGGERPCAHCRSKVRKMYRGHWTREEWRALHPEVVQDEEATVEQEPEAPEEQSETNETESAALYLYKAATGTVHGSTDQLVTLCGRATDNLHLTDIRDELRTGEQAEEVTCKSCLRLMNKYKQASSSSSED